MFPSIQTNNGSRGCRARPWAYTIQLALMTLAIAGCSGNPAPATLGVSHSTLLEPGPMRSLKSSVFRVSLNQDRSDLINRSVLRSTSNVKSPSALINTALPGNISSGLVQGNGLLQATNSVTESEDCYTELNKQIKKLLNKLDKLRKHLLAQANNQQQAGNPKGAIQALLSNNLDTEQGAGLLQKLLFGDRDSNQDKVQQYQQETQPPSEGDKSTQELSSDLIPSMGDLIREQFQQLDGRLTDRECPPNDQLGETKANNNSSRLPFDPSQVDLIYMTLQDYKQTLEALIAEIEAEFEKSMSELFDDAFDGQGNFDLDFNMEDFHRLRDALTKFALKQQVQGLRLQVKGHLRETLGNFLFKRDQSPTTSLGLFGPIVDMIGGTDARVAAQYLLEPLFKQGIDQAARELPMDYLQCLDEDKIKKREPQC